MEAVAPVAADVPVPAALPEAPGVVALPVWPLDPVDPDAAPLAALPVVAEPLPDLPDMALLSCTWPLVSRQCVAAETLPDMPVFEFILDWAEAPAVIMSVAAEAMSASFAAFMEHLLVCATQRLDNEACAPSFRPAGEKRERSGLLAYRGQSALGHTLGSSHAITSENAR